MRLVLIAVLRNLMGLDSASLQMPSFFLRAALQYCEKVNFLTALKAS